MKVGVAFALFLLYLLLRVFMLEVLCIEKLLSDTPVELGDSSQFFLPLLIELLFTEKSFRLILFSLSTKSVSLYSLNCFMGGSAFVLWPLSAINLILTFGSSLKPLYTVFIFA